MIATLCDWCGHRITDPTSGPDGSIDFEHREGGDREPSFVTVRLHFHRRCLDGLRAMQNDPDPQETTT